MKNSKRELLYDILQTLYTIRDGICSSECEIVKNLGIYNLGMLTANIEMELEEGDLDE